MNKRNNKHTSLHICLLLVVSSSFSLSSFGNDTSKAGEERVITITTTTQETHEIKCSAEITDTDCVNLAAEQRGFTLAKDGNGDESGAGGDGSEEDSGEDGSNKNKFWETCEKNNPEKFIKCIETAEQDIKLYNTDKSDDNIQYRGSQEAKTCQAVFKKASSGANWKEVSSQTFRDGSYSGIDYDKAVAIFAIELGINKERPDNTPEAAINAQKNDILSFAIKKVAACSQVAAAFGENFEEGHDEKDPYIEPEKLTSLDGKIECHLMGLETLDYDECASLVFAHNGAELGTAANNTFQQYEAQSLRSEQQQKLMNMDPNSNVTTAALKTQKDNLATQQDMAEQRRALQAARLATIATMSANIPTKSSYLKSNKLCKRPVDEALSKIDQSIKDHVGGIQGGVTLCKANIAKFSFFRNGEAKRVGNTIAAQAGVEVAAETMAVSQLGKQKRMIDGAIGKIEGMNTLELPEDFYQNEDVYMQFCTANPTHPDCQTGFGASVNVPSFGDYNVGGFGTNQAYQPTDTTESTGAAGSTTSDPTSANVDTSTAVTKSNPSGGLKGRFGSPATVTEGGSLAQGAGGGGSSPSGGGGGGGSSAGGGGEPQAGATTASGGTKGLSYIGGRGPSFVGGRGIASRRKNTKNDANPFKNMFDKNKNRNLSSLNFKGKAAIGSKSGNLFQRISSAYDKANNKGNLLKYETKSIE